MKNVVPFKQSDTFRQYGIDWTRAAATERERQLREAFLTYEASCGPNGLVSLLLLLPFHGARGPLRTICRLPPITPRFFWR